MKKILFIVSKNIYLLIEIKFFRLKNNDKILILIIKI